MAIVIQPVILAAGNGRRIIREAMAAGMGELPKVLYPLHKKPLIDYPLERLVEVKQQLAADEVVLKKPLVVVKFMQELVRSHLKDRVEYVEQNPKPLGTGHAVLVCESKVATDVDGVLVLNGDMPAWRAETIINLINLFVRDKPTLALATVLFTDPKYDTNFFAYGRIIRDDQGRLQRIVEQKDASPEEQQVSECNPSLYCFKRDWLFSALREVKNNNSQKEYYLTDLLSIAINQNQPVESVEVVDWREALGVNTLAQLELTAGLLK